MGKFDDGMKLATELATMTPEAIRKRFAAMGIRAAQGLTDSCAISEYLKISTGIADGEISTRTTHIEFHDENTVQHVPLCECDTEWVEHLRSHPSHTVDRMYDDVECDYTPTHSGAHTFIQKFDEGSYPELCNGKGYAGGGFIHGK